MTAQPPALLQVLPALRSGGVECGTLEIAEAQIATGFRAIVASAGGEMVPALHGWRREVFGDAALALRSGQLALGVDGRRVKLIPAG